MEPYLYTGNNPIMFTDPAGLSASPIYDTDGKFIANDSEGNTGEILFMDRNIYNIISKQKNYTNEKGELTHYDAKRFAKNIDQVIGDGSKKHFGYKELNMINNAITDIFYKMDGTNVNDLHNEKTSSSYFQGMGSSAGLRNFGVNDGKGNYDSVAYQQSNKHNNRVSVGKTIINFNINEFMGNVGLVIFPKKRNVKKYSLLT